MSMQYPGFAVGGEKFCGVGRRLPVLALIVSVWKNQLDSAGDVSILMAVLFCRQDNQTGRG